MEEEVKSINRTVGDMLTYNLRVSVKIFLLICFSKSLSESNNSDYNCVKCWASLHNHLCDNNEQPNYFVDHSIRVFFNYSPCNLSYHLTIYKNHLTFAESGIIAISTFTGEGYKLLKTIKLNVYPHTQNYIYIILSIVITIIAATSLSLVRSQIKKKCCLKNDSLRGTNNCEFLFIFCVEFIWSALVGYKVSWEYRRKIPEGKTLMHAC